MSCGLFEVIVYFGGTLVLGAFPGSPTASGRRELLHITGGHSVVPSFLHPVASVAIYYIALASVPSKPGSAVSALAAAGASGQITLVVAVRLSPRDSRTMHSPTLVPSRLGSSR